jgi:hypothetical protein
VTGTDATSLPAASAPRRLPECPGKVYLAELERDFERPDPRAADKLITALGSEPAVRIDASSSVAAQIARVDGKLHIFLANFGGLIAGQNAVQTPERGIRVTVPAAAGKAWLLPFLGEALEVQGQYQDGNRIFVLPAIHKGAILWFEGR